MTPIPKSGPNDSNRAFGYASYNHAGRVLLSGGSAPNYAPSANSGRLNSLRKEPVHLPYKSASPDFAEPQSHVSRGCRPDSTFTPRYGAGRSRYRSAAISMAAFYGGGPDLHLFSAVRCKSFSGRQKDGQQLPQLSVVPAPKCNRLQQQRKTHAAVATTAGASGAQAPPAPKPVVVKRVEVSLHEVQQTPRLVSGTPSASQDGENQTSASPRLNLKEKMQSVQQQHAARETPNIVLKSVDLNKGLNAASAIRKRSPAGPKRCSLPLEKVLASKETTHVVSLGHLPLREVYLKPETTAGKEQAFQEQQNKNIRILNWLKDLKYLDEKAVQRGRSEVERTQFQLPEINESALLL